MHFEPSFPDLNGVRRGERYLPGPGVWPRLWSAKAVRFATRGIFAARPGQPLGRVVKLDPMKPKLKAPGNERLCALKLNYVELLSDFAFKFNLRRFISECRGFNLFHNALRGSIPMEFSRQEQDNDLPATSLTRICRRPRRRPRRRRPRSCPPPRPRPCRRRPRPRPRPHHPMSQTPSCDMFLAKSTAAISQG